MNYRYNPENIPSKDEFEDMDDYEEDICGCCLGTGEGRGDGSTCQMCKGTGILAYRKELE